MDVKSLLLAVKNGTVSIEKAEEQLKTLPFDDLGFALPDSSRKKRTGFAEVIFCEGKTPEETAQISKSLAKSGENVLATRASREHFAAVSKIFPKALYNETARTIFLCQKKIQKIGSVCICTAGTSDIPVAEEAAVTAEAFGCEIIRVYDVGVAGIHRLFSKIDKIRKANVVIAAAGMEGALASVVGGLVERPVIALPTSIGYGSNFGGVSALLAMLNSCAAGVGVVNIDNGFGAGFLAGQINRLLYDKLCDKN